MIAVIRISGQVNLNEKIKETLNRLRIKKKYTCVVLPETKENSGMVKKVAQYVAYGKIDDKTLIELIEKRGKPIDKTKKLDAKAVAEGLLKGNKPEKLNLKPFFALHPARGGIKTKFTYPKGVLGNHKDKIGELIRRML